MLEPSGQSTPSTLSAEGSTKVAKEALETNRSVYDIVLEKGLMTQEKLDEALDPKNMLVSHRIMK